MTLKEVAIASSGKLQSMVSLQNKQALDVQLTIGERIKMMPLCAKRHAQQDHYKKAQVFPI